jgi:hypothetical protein
VRPLWKKLLQRIQIWLADRGVGQYPRSAFRALPVSEAPTVGPVTGAAFMVVFGFLAICFGLFGLAILVLLIFGIVAIL